MTTTPVEPAQPPGVDPHARVRRGDPNPPARELAGCQAFSDRGYLCTRARHPDTWQHIANGSARVVAVWGGAGGDPE